MKPRAVMWLVIGLVAVSYARLLVHNHALRLRYVVHTGPMMIRFAGSVAK